MPRSPACAKLFNSSPFEDPVGGGKAYPQVGYNVNGTEGGNTGCGSLVRLCRFTIDPNLTSGDTGNGTTFNAKLTDLKARHIRDVTLRYDSCATP